ncbi:MAG: MNIO family bufferin maturase [Chromatiales bacterium]
MLGSSKQSASGRPIPADAGIGLRAEHYDVVLEQRPRVGFLEVHSENYFGAGGRPLQVLEAVRRDWPLSLHGVGLSLGSTDELNLTHLRRLKTLVDRFSPMLVSDHLCWSSIDGRYVNDLLPLPHTEEALLHVSERIRRVQDHLGRQILIENLSSYLEFAQSAMPEWEFLTAVAERSDCGILLDVNNIFVSASNHGFDAAQYLRGVPVKHVREIHLAGHSVNAHAEGVILVDTHNQRVCEEVWQLYALAVERFGEVPTLIEWDTDLPALDVLVDEARKADHIQAGYRVLAA